MSFRSHTPHAHQGQRVGSGHCVAFVQTAAGVPHTSRWRRGQKVRGNDIEPGTAIATFSPSGRYENRTDGASHAAILIAEESNGLHVWDQWSGQPVHKRIIRFKGGQGTANNDGDAFHVIDVV